jgi:putative phosphoserine phosphatase/1-acylglycerol-3-phosphate O-acyltransferase
MRRYDKIIKEVEQSPEGPHIGAFFDFDGTIIYGYSAITYLREQIRRGDVKPRQLLEIVATMTNFGLGNMGFSAMMSSTSKYLKGVEEKDYVEFGEALYKKHIAKLVYPESQALIEAHLKKGHTVALISAATPYQVNAAAEELGIEHVRCTRLETAAGRFTGNVIKPTCYGMGKVAAAQGFEDSHGVQPKQSYFYSDSDEDIQLLEYVGKPRPLNPNAKLRRIASGRGWPVQDFNSRGNVGIKDYVRTLAAQGSMLTSALAGIPIYALTGSMRKSRNFSVSLFADMATSLAGIELDVTGEENVWTNRPCVFVFNHQSQADTIIIPALLRRDLAGVGKKEIGDMPIIGKLMQIGGTVLIDRENTASAMEAMMPLVDAIQKEGQCVCIAPEGTRSTSTNLGRFKKGAFHLALQAGVPVVPIVIHNAIDVAPRGQFIIRPATVKITVLPPVDTSAWTAQTMGEHVDQVRDMFLEELDQMVLQGPHQRAKHEPTSETVAVKAKTKIQGKANNNSNPADTSRAQLKAVEAADPSPQKTLAKAGEAVKASALESSKVASRVANRNKSTVAATVAKQVKVAPASKSIAKKIQSKVATPKVAKSKAVKTKTVTAKLVTKKSATAKPLKDIQSKSKVVAKVSSEAITAISNKESATLTAEADKKTPRESTANSTVNRISKRRSKPKSMVKVSARAINDDGGPEIGEAKLKVAGPSSKSLKKRTSKKAQDKDSN